MVSRSQVLWYLRLKYGYSFVHYWLLTTNNPVSSFQSSLMSLYLEIPLTSMGEQVLNMSPRLSKNFLLNIPCRTIHLMALPHWWWKAMPRAVKLKMSRRKRKSVRVGTFTFESRTEALTKPIAIPNMIGEYYVDVCVKFELLYYEIVNTKLIAEKTGSRIHYILSLIDLSSH